VVTLDFRGQRAYFEPTGQTQLTKAVFGTGLMLDKPQHSYFEVIDILPGTDAERVGVKRGDHLVKIDGHPAEELGLADVANLNGSPSRGSLAVETDNGRRFDLKISQILPRPE
jgi:C-terminal processing protease CtpA/Prc